MITIPTGIPAAVLAGIFGLIFGSLITLLSHRLVHGGSMLVARSRCPKCHHPLGVLDLFPVLSWMFSGAKCRYCKARISVRYPLIELATGAWFLLIELAYGFSLATVLLCAIAVALMVMIVVDLEHQIIPDEVQIALVLLALPYAYLWQVPLMRMLVMALSLFLLSYGLRYGFRLWKQKEGLGLGDVKFFTVVGLYLAPMAIAPFMLYSGIMGIVFGLTWRIMGLGERFPFGPALALSFFICIAFPQWGEHAVGILQNYYP